MTIDINKIPAWFEARYGAITYSMNGSRNGSDGTADCSGSVTQAVYEAGGSTPSYLFSTVTLGGYLSANGFVRISANEDWNAERGDVILMSWSPDMSGSGGAGGHTGVMLNGTDFISCDYSTNGAYGTAITSWNWNDYYNRTAPMYIEVWRYEGSEPVDVNPINPPTGEVTAIERFKQGGNEYTMYNPIRVDEVKFENGLWQAINKTLAGGDDFNWALNGLPLEAMHRTDGGDEDDIEVGAMVAFNDGFNHGTIDEYDEATNGCRINMGKYGDVWFNADELLKL